MSSYRIKEGGWGWVITAASFLIHVIVGGISFSCGVWQMIFHSYFGKSHYETAWLPSVLLALTVLGGIPSTLICYKFGYRASVMLGALLACAGFGLSMFCNELHELYLSLGVVAGLGLGLTLTPSIMVLKNFFYENHIFAAGVAATGISLGITFFPVAIYHLEEMYAWKGAALMLVAICANILVCGMTMRPSDQDDRASRKNLLKIFEPTVFKSIAFDVLLLSNLIWSAGVAIIFFNLADYSMSTGVPREEAIMLVGVVGMTHFISRATFELFSMSAKLDVTSNFLCSAGLAAILTGLFTEFFKHKAGEIGYGILFGLHCGFWSTFVTSVTGELFSEEVVAYGRGYISLSIGTGLVLGPPLAGWIIDEGYDYDVVFYLAGSCLVVSSCLMLSINIKKCYYRPSNDVRGKVTTGSSIGTKSVSSGIEEEQLMVTSLLTAV